MPSQHLHSALIYCPPVTLCGHQMKAGHRIWMTGRIQCPFKCGFVGSDPNDLTKCSVPAVVLPLRCYSITYSESIILCIHTQLWQSPNQYPCCYDIYSYSSQKCEILIILYTDLVTKSQITKNPEAELQRLLFI